MFPANWAQTWVYLPDAGYRDQNASSLMQWWLTDPVPDPATWDYNQFSLDLNLHLLTGPMAWAWSAHSAVLRVDFQAYINTPSSIIFSGIGFITNLWDYGPALPSTKCVVFRTFAAGEGKRNRGRKYICPVPELYVGAEGILNAAGLILYNATRNYLMTSFTSQGTTFTPVLVSYADGAAKPIVRVEVNSRLGNIKRRGRKNFKTLPTQPKTPPP